MKRLFLAIVCLFMALTLIACDTPSPTPTPTPDGGTATGTVFDDLFDKDNHISIKLDIADTELAKMQADYEYYSSFGSKSPIYRIADMAVTITTPTGKKLEWAVEQVGVRMKGNTSRQAFYSEDEGMYNLIHLKLSFGETFDNPTYYGDDALLWADEDAKLAREKRTFATLEKMDLRWNRNDDTTYIREGYAYDLYREYGVLAPHTNLASVDIGEDHAGVFTIYEPIDKLFLEKNLPLSAQGGDLYKCGWTHQGASFTSFSSYGIENEDAGEFYMYDLKTNKKTSTHESLKTLIETVNKRGLKKEAFASVVDVENFMYFCAVSYFIGNPDDLRNNYNNCYVYFRADTGKAMFIPYDLDRGLGVNTWNPYGDGMTTDSPFAIQNVVGEQKNPLFLKSVTEGGLFLEEYMTALQAVDASPSLTPTVFATKYEVAKNLYQQNTTPSKRYRNAWDYRFTFDIDATAESHESANMSFVDYITAKKQTLHSAIGGDTPVFPEYVAREYKPYIRADYTNWEKWENQGMELCDEGVYSITITQTSTFRFKVYDDITQNWYGAECIPEGSEVSYDSDGHTNVVLAPGTYVVYFHAKDQSITLEKQ